MHLFRYFRILTLTIVALLMAGIASAQSTELTSNHQIFAAPHDGGLRRWQLTPGPTLELVRAPGDSDATGILLIAGAIVTNFGCAQTVGEMWCEVRQLHGGPKGFVGANRLIPVAGPDGIIARGPNDSAQRAKRKNFDATTQILCAQEAGEALSLCGFGVARSAGGDATAAVTFRNGFVRFLYFMHGEFISASATMSGAGRDTDWVVQDAVHKIRVDDQQFEIPDTVLFNAE